MNPELLEVLCCPLCHGVVVDNERCLRCESCAQEYLISDGIPDMRVYESASCVNEFNKKQALYEARLHDEESESGYEKTVIRIFGMKTRAMVENWAMEMDKASTSKVLDYGCGTGQVSRFMAGHVQSLFAFDISEKSLRKNILENNVLGVLANSLYLPFKDKVFSTICINGVLHHIIDLERATFELARICAGSVYISEGVSNVKPFFSKILSYPGFNRKFAYFCYRVFSRLSVLLNKRNGTSKIPSSKYERPLDIAMVEPLIEKNGFKRSRLLYYTNIDLPGDSIIKNILTRLLVNNVVGTHFDLRMDRKFNDVKFES